MIDTGIGVFFRGDIAAALQAAEQASAMTLVAIGDVADPVAVRAYRAGFRAALVTLAMAFGIERGGEGGEQRRLDDR